MYAYYQVINRHETLQNSVVQSSLTGLLEIPLHPPQPKLVFTCEPVYQLNIRHYDDNTLSGVVEGLGVAQVSGIVTALMESEGSLPYSQQTLRQMNPIHTLTLT